MMWLILMSLITKLHCVVSLLAAIRVAFCETFSFNSFSHSCCAIIYTNLMDSASNYNVEWIYWKQLREANRALLRMQKNPKLEGDLWCEFCTFRSTFLCCFDWDFNCPVECTYSESINVLLFTTIANGFPRPEKCFIGRSGGECKTLTLISGESRAVESVSIMRFQHSPRGHWHCKTHSTRNLLPCIMHPKGERTARSRDHLSIFINTIFVPFPGLRKASASSLS